MTPTEASIKLAPMLVEKAGWHMRDRQLFSPDYQIWLHSAENIALSAEIVEAIIVGVLAPRGVHIEEVRFNGVHFGWKAVRALTDYVMLADHPTPTAAYRMAIMLAAIEVLQ